MSCTNDSIIKTRNNMIVDYSGIEKQVLRSEACAQYSLHFKLCNIHRFYVSINKIIFSGINCDAYDT